VPIGVSTKGPRLSGDAGAQTHSPGPCKKR